MDFFELQRFVSKFADNLSDEVNVKYVIDETVVIIEVVTPVQLTQVLNQSKKVIVTLNNRHSDDVNKHAIAERTILTPEIGPVLVIYEFS